MSASKDKKPAPKGHTQHGGLNSTTQRLGGSMRSTPALRQFPHWYRGRTDSSLGDTEVERGWDRMMIHDKKN